MSHNLTLDRRILKAFYMQYVAVLLIVLVLRVGVAARVSQLPRESTHLYVNERAQASIGTIELAELFADADSVQLKDSREIEAVLEVLKNHDVHATFTVYAPSGPEMSQSLRLAVLRARAIQSHVMSGNVPLRALKLVVAPTPDGVAHAKVSFASMEASDDRS